MVYTKKRLRKKQNSRKSKSKSRKLKGGKYIASGTYGCVFKPAIKCRGETTRIDGVSKLMEKREARAEIEEQKKVDKIDPTFMFHLRPPKLCEIGELDSVEDNIQRCDLKNKGIKSNLNNAVLLQMPYGGIDVNEAIKMKLKEPLDYKIVFMCNMSYLLKGLVKFKKNEFAHLDIKAPNVLYNPETRRFNYIDFGLSSYYKDIKFDRNFLFGSFYFIYPPEIIMLRPDIFKKINERKNKDEIISANISIPDYTRKMQDQLIQYYNIKKPEHIHNITGDIFYDPELIGMDEIDLRNKLYEKIDIYSLGLLMVFTFIQFTELQPDFLNEGINEGKYPDPIFKDIEKLIVSMTKNNYKERATPEEAYSQIVDILRKYRKNRNTEGIRKIPDSSGAAASASGYA